MRRCEHTDEMGRFSLKSRAQHLVACLGETEDWVRQAVDLQRLAESLPECGYKLTIHTPAGKYGLTRKQWMYRQYLRTPDWQARRYKWLLASGGMCQRCGIGGEVSGLDVHHLTYDRLGEELESDVVVVCRPCHEKADQERLAGEECSDYKPRPPL